MQKDGRPYLNLTDGDYIVHEVFGIGIYRGLETIKNACFVQYLQSALRFLKDANESRGSDKPPIGIIWESQLHDYLMKHSSLGNVTPEPVIGPNGTTRLT